MKIQFSLLLALPLLLECKGFSEENPNAESPLRPSVAVISTSHTEGKGIGYTKGYTSLEGLFFPFSSQETFFPFIDIRGHVFNNGESAANAGVGVRMAPTTCDVIFGANAYYDYRFARKGSNFNQLGFGLEALGKRLDWRLNAYVPLTNHKTLFTDLYDDYTNGYYILHKKFGIPMGGANLEMGVLLAESKYVNFYGAIGPYYFASHFLRSRHTFGGELRLDLTIAKYLSLEGRITRDSIFKTRVQGQIALNFPLGPQSNKTKKSTRLEQSVERYEIIVLDKVNRWKWNY